MNSSQSQTSSSGSNDSRATPTPTLPRRALIALTVEGDPRAPVEVAYTPSIASIAAAIVELTQGMYAFRLVAPGSSGQVVTISPGVSLHVVKAGKTAWGATAVIGNLPQALHGASVIHVHDPAGSLGQWSLMLARLYAIPLCVTDSRFAADSPYSQLRLCELADAIVCGSFRSAARFRVPSHGVSSHGREDLLAMSRVDRSTLQPFEEPSAKPDRPDLQEAAGTLWGVYQELLIGTGRAAA